MPHKSYLNCYKRATLSEAGPVSIHAYCTLFPPSKHFACFTTFHLCGNSFLQSWRARALSLTTGPVAKIQCSHHHDLMLNLWLGTKALLQAVVGRDHLRSLWVYFNIFITFWSKCIICKNNRGVEPCLYAAKCTLEPVLPGDHVRCWWSLCLVGFVPTVRTPRLWGRRCLGTPTPHIAPDWHEATMQRAASSRCSDGDSYCKQVWRLPIRRKTKSTALQIF